MCSIDTSSLFTQAVNKSAENNQSQLVGEQNGDVVVPVCDWTSFLKMDRKIKDMKKQHQFVMTAKRPGTIHGPALLIIQIRVSS